MGLLRHGKTVILLMMLAYLASVYKLPAEGRNSSFAMACRNRVPVKINLQHYFWDASSKLNEVLWLVRNRKDVKKMGVEADTFSHVFVRLITCLQQ